MVRIGHGFELISIFLPAQDDEKDDVRIKRRVQPCIMKDICQPQAAAIAAPMKGARKITGPAADEMETDGPALVPFTGGRLKSRAWPPDDNLLPTIPISTRSTSNISMEVERPTRMPTQGDPEDTDRDHSAPADAVGQPAAGQLPEAISQ